jgi:hypothetical protein
MHNIKSVEKIKQVCKEYLNHQISLRKLQITLGAICSNFENDVPIELQRAALNFVEDLEYIQFMRNESEHFNFVAELIKKLNIVFSQYN